MKALRAIAVAAAIVASFASATGDLRAQEYDFDKPPAEPLDPVDLCIKIYKELGNCVSCHGWNGNGGNGVMLQDGGMLDPAPPFGKSPMSRDEMIEIVSCGKLLPGNVMPSFREFAWTAQFPCGGKTAADVPGEQRPFIWEVPLYAEEVEAVVDWVIMAYLGKEFSLELCQRYYGPESRGCDLLKK